MVSPSTSNRWLGIAESLDNWLDSHWRAYLVAASLLCVATFVGYSHAKAPWNDEVLQLSIERLDTVQQVWETVRGGTVQVDPPPLHILGHLLLKSFGGHVLAARAASIAGFLLMCLSFALLLRRHLPAIYAAAGFFMPYATALRARVPDARPYAVMFGFSALTLLCWDAMNEEAPPSARRNLWRAGFCLSLAAVLSTHFFAIFFFVGLGAAELVKWSYRKRLDWPALGLMALAVVPYIFWLPTLLNARRLYIQHYFFPVKFENFYNFYNFATHGLPLAGVLLFLVLLIALVPTLDRPATAPLSLRLRYLMAATAGFLFVPAAGYILGLTVTGLFVNYYHLAATFGVILGVPLAVMALGAGSRVAGLALFVAIFGHGLFVTTRGLSGFRRVDDTYPSLTEMRKLIPAESNPNIVIPSPLHFLPLQEANRLDPNDSILYLYDPVKALAALGSDTADLCLYYVKAASKARIEPFDAWIEAHPTFYIASLGETVGVQEWQFDYLMRNPNVRLTWIGQVKGFRLYRVQVSPGGLR